MTSATPTKELAVREPAPSARAAQQAEPAAQTQAGSVRQQHAGPVRADRARPDSFDQDRSFFAYDWRLLRWLWSFVKPHSKLLCVSFALLLVTAGTALVRPLLMKRLVDVGAMQRDPSALTHTGGLLLGLVLVDQVLTFIQVYSMQIAGARAMADLRAHTFRFLHGLRLSFFDRQPIGRLVTRVTNDTDAISDLFASGALNALGDLVRLVGIVVMMLALDWRLSLIAFAALPPVALFVNRIRAGSRLAFREIRVQTARLNALLNEQVAGMSVVQALCHERASAAEFDETNGAYRNANFRAIKFEATLDAAIEMVSAVCVALLLVAAGFRAASVGTVVAFVAYIRQFFEPISNLSQRYTLLQSAMAGAEKVYELLEVKEPDAPSVATVASVRPASSPGIATEPAAPVFELSQVQFEYRPNVPVLQDVTLRAFRGETIAVVGATGSGKTTIANLLLRLYEPVSGCVRVLGRDVRSYDRAALRRLFAAVPQDVYLFPGTVLTNVAVGDPLPDRDRVQRALESVGAFDSLQKRGWALEMRVEERGSNFSAGERQLIAFARAIYRDPPMLILDEATANVDSETESRIQRALSKLMEGRTALVIAHRLSTIRAASRIVVMNKGRIVEEGTHEQLLARGGAYARLYRLRYAQDAVEVLSSAH